MAITKSRTGTVDPKTGVTVNVTDANMTEQEKQRAAAEKAKASTANAAGDSLLGDATPDPGNVDIWGNPIPTTNTPPASGTAPTVGESFGIPDQEPPPLLEPPNTTPIGEVPQRDVQGNELVSNQLDALLSGDSAYIRQARLQGLEYGGGLGGSLGIRSATGAAINAALPIAQWDAQAYRDAAAQNMDAMTQFGLANIQRATQLEVATMNNNTAITTTWMTNQTQAAIARMQDITNRDIANLDAATRVRIQEMSGEIQKSLAEAQFRFNQVLEDQRQAGVLESTALTGEYNLEQQAMQMAAADQINYTSMYMNAYNGALDRLTALNGMDIDQDAVDRSIEAIWEGFYGQVDLIKALYPNATPIDFEGQG